MKKKIARVMPVGFGHLMLEFEDGVKKMAHRGSHEAHQPKPGGGLRPPDGHRARNRGRTDRGAQKEAG